ncbi:hypothetical protein, partial [Klebsiella pneumoniae]|uniref:hypothetical protein n=1 Tax=Klebsiella pneumoniae TaxID=573 RepID=UPI0016818AE6
VTDARRALAARTTPPRSAALSSLAASHSLSIAAPEINRLLIKIKHQFCGNLSGVCNESKARKQMEIVILKKYFILKNI